MPKNTTQCLRSGLEPRPLAPESCALTMRPPRLPFETRTATGSELFSLLSWLHMTAFALSSIFSPLEMLGIKIWETPLSRHAKCPLPVVVRVSKTCVLKLPIVRVPVISEKYFSLPRTQLMFELMILYFNLLCCFDIFFIQHLLGNVLLFSLSDLKNDECIEF